MTERRVIELDEHGNVTTAEDYDDTELRLLIDEARRPAVASKKRSCASIELLSS